MTEHEILASIDTRLNMLQQQYVTSTENLQSQISKILQQLPNEESLVTEKQCGQNHKWVWIAIGGVGSLSASILMLMIAAIVFGA